MLEQLVAWLIEHWNDLTIGILLVVIIYGGSREDPWWVFGREFKKEREEKSEYKQMAFDFAGIADKSLNVAEKKKATK